MSNQRTPRPDRLSPQQAADILGVSKVTVINYITTGQMPAWRIGTLYKIDRDVVENFAQPVGRR